MVSPTLAGVRSGTEGIGRPEWKRTARNVSRNLWSGSFFGWGEGATKFNSNKQIFPEPKAHIKERMGFSPDGGDAAALTFAEPVSSFANNAMWDRKLEEGAREIARGVV